jgi:hypothetical protein
MILKELPPTYTSCGRIVPRGRGRTFEIWSYGVIPLRRGCTDAPWPDRKAKAPCCRGSEVWTELLVSSSVEGRERTERRVKVARKMECMRGGPEEPRRGDAHGSDREAW